MDSKNRAKLCTRLGHMALRYILLNDQGVLLPCRQHVAGLWHAILSSHRPSSWRDAEVGLGRVARAHGYVQVSLLLGACYGVVVAEEQCRGVKMDRTEVNQFF